jgi:hypothetical protein
MLRIYLAYEEICERSGVVDFTELLLRALELLRENTSLLGHYQNRFKHILVDEFQDTNTIQYAWLGLLAGSAGHLFPVGDDDPVTGSPEMVRQSLFIGLALPFVREHETEADLVGLDYMAKAGFDPRAAVYLWKSMAAAHAAEDGKLRQAEFLRTHPTDSVRLNDIAGTLGPALATYNAAREVGKRPNCTIAGTR